MPIGLLFDFCVKSSATWQLCFLPPAFALGIEARRAGERPKSPGGLLQNKYELNNVSCAAVDQGDVILGAGLILPVRHREERLHRELHHRPERDHWGQLHHVGQRRNRIFPLREPDYRQLLGMVLEDDTNRVAIVPLLVVYQFSQANWRICCVL